jgi:phosphatidylglycerophosphatase A
MDQQKSTLLKFCDLLATGFYTGKAPKAPGTAGSAGAVILVYILYSSFPVLQQTIPGFFLAVLVTGLSILICNLLISNNFYGKDLKDPQQIVIDEFAGIFITAIGSAPTLLNLVLIFVLFRVFDISKIPPIKKLEKLPKGWGITLDDCLAGVYALISLLTLNLLLPLQ